MPAAPRLIPLPIVPGLLTEPGQSAAPPAFTGQQSEPAASTAAPRKSPADPNVTPAPANVTQPDHLDPADFTALRQVLETAGTFRPAPADPPWTDPRPDLATDRSRWWLLLEAAYRLDGQDPAGLYGALYGLRCCGARLELANAATWGARPEDPPPTYRLVRGDELSEAAYQDLRQRYLVPHREALTRLLSAPSAAQIAHPRAASAQTPGKTPEKDRHIGGAAPFTGHGAAAAQSAPRKSGAGHPAAQPALLETAPAAQPAPVPGGDW